MSILQMKTVRFRQVGAWEGWGSESRPSPSRARGCRVPGSLSLHRSQPCSVLVLWRRGPPPSQGAWCAPPGLARGGMHGPRPGSAGPHCTSPHLPRALASTMKGSQASSSPPRPSAGSLEGLDLSLTGLPPPISRRPNSASAAKPIARSISVATGSEPKGKALVSVQLGRPGARGVAVRMASDSGGAPHLSPLPHPALWPPGKQGGPGGEARP